MPTLPNENEVGIKISTKADNKGIDQAESRLKSFANNATSASLSIIGGFTGVAASVGTLGLASIKMAADMEQTQIAFKTLLGDGEKAKDFIAGLRKDAAKSPFELQPILEMNQALLGAGLAAEESRRTVMQLGNVLSATGKGAAEMQRIGNTISQVFGKGKADAVDFKELVNAGWVSVKKDVSETLGVTTLQLEDLVSEGVVGFEELSQTLNRVAGDGGKFGTAMEEQSTSLNGLLSTLKDNVRFTMADIGKELMETFDIKGLISQAIPYLESFGSTVKNDIIPFLKENGSLVKAFAIGIGTTLVLALGAVTIAFIAANAAALPWIALLVGIGIAAGALYYAWETNFLGIRDITQGVISFFTGTVIPGIQAFVQSVSDGITWLKNNWAEAIGFIIGFGASLVVKLPFYILQAIGQMIAYIRSVDWANVLDSILTAAKNVWLQVAAAATETLSNIDWGSAITGLGTSIADMAKGAIKGAFAGTGLKLPKFADGVRNFSGGMALVGERGPELVNLPRGSDVTPNHQLGGKNTTINQTNHIYNNVDMTASMREIGWQLNI